MENSSASNESNINIDQTNDDKPLSPKKPVKPPKLEDKPFEEFINNHFIPGLEKSLLEKGSQVNEIKLIHGTRPVVGGICWMV